MRYTELANKIVKCITDGEFALGEQLPSELAMTERYKVSRSTVRAALDIVQNLGLVSRRRRVGTIVRATAPTNSYTKSLHTIEDLVNYAEHTERHVLNIGTVVADEPLAANLECKPGEKWLRISMLRTEKGGSKSPLCWNDAYLDPNIGEHVVSAIPDGTGLLCHIIQQEAGIIVADIKQTIGATFITGEIAHQLLVDNSTPGLQVTRHYLDAAGKTYLITVNTYPADKFRFTFWMHRENTA